MDLVPRINPYHYDKLIKKCREFLQSRHVVECYLNNRQSILSACESPQSVVPFSYRGLSYALPQTSQLWLELVILSESQSQTDWFYNVTTSFRNEENPVKGRHDVIFNMLEIEGPVDFDQMIEFQKDFLQWLGFGDKQNYVEVDYMDMCQKYGVDELTHEHEYLMGEEYGRVVFLKYFPEEESFWNMKRCGGKLVKKVDVLLGSPNVKTMEVIGSGERSIDVEQMRQSFLSQTNGEYSQLLYDKFGQERVNQELDEYLSLPMFTRSGMGIGLTRLMSVMLDRQLL